MQANVRSSIVDKQVEFLLQFELNVQAAKSLDLIWQTDTTKDYFKNTFELPVLTCLL